MAHPTSLVRHLASCPEPVRVSDAELLVNAPAMDLGGVVRDHRRAAGLTQEELAERAGVSPRSISELERGGAHTPRRDTVALLVRALGLDGPARETVEALVDQRRRARQAQPSASPSQPHARLWPAARTSFVGRARELAEVTRLSASHRLVTLTGPGGTGKTRVALEAAAVLLDRHPDGVFFVGLAPISDPRLVTATIAQAVGVSDDGRRTSLDVLANALRRRAVLLILDNFEQVLAAAPEVGELLDRCPRLHLLVTSRAPLRLSGEQELAVPPLDQDESVRLFVERACAVKSDFVLTAENAPAVAELCRRLDGLPLAIELAAARSRLLDPRAMVSRFERRLPLLVGGLRDAPARQQTLRDTIAWSYDLLEPDDQVLFRHLAIFVGGFTLESAQAVCGLRQHEALERLDSLAAKNLLRPVPAATGEVRIAMLETVREFGLEQLSSTDQLAALRRRHAAYFLDLAERSEPALNGPDVSVWLRRLEAEHDNLRAALDWSLADPVAGEDQAVRLAGALGRFWWMAGHFGEGSRWLARALDQRAAVAPSEARMKALHAAGWLAHVQRDCDSACTLLEQSLAIAAERDNQWWRAWILHALGRVAYFDNDAVRAAELGQQTLALAEALGDAWLEAWALHLLGLAAYVGRDYRTAHAYYERCLTIRGALGHLEGMLIVLHLDGIAVYRLGRPAEALALLRQALEIARQVDSAWFYTCLLPVFASFAAQHQPRCAARLGGTVTALSESAGTLPIPITEALFNESMGVARRKLGDTAFRMAWAQGQALSVESALAEAQAVEMAPEAASPARLTPAELAVLRRLARGKTTQQIATDLLVAVSTVDRHISHIYQKIGRRGRSAATMFALEHGLV